ncbi:hypothetical protein CEE44_02835 [Candidatus Woesearchaeota archaeon B3_Woes]|nr:MAG: hypothetical protein CEE44_02835 [Candidatus Woesearchaeota archaeon B3_Woes]
MVDNIVNLRNMKKKKKPDFNKQSSHKKKRLANKWRKPRGSDSKIKIGRKGYPRKVKVGFRGPVEARGMSRDGQNIVLIKNMNDIKGLNKDDVVCLSNFGIKKKIEIVKECLKLNLKIMSLKDPAKFLSDSETNLKEQKESKKKKQEEKSKKIAEKKSKDEDKKDGIEAKVDDEDKKKEKKEKDKLLTKREV